LGITDSDYSLRWVGSDKRHVLGAPAFGKRLVALLLVSGYVIGVALTPASHCAVGIIGVERGGGFVQPSACRPVGCDPFRCPVRHCPSSVVSVALTVTLTVAVAVSLVVLAVVVVASVVVVAAAVVVAVSVVVTVAACVGSVTVGVDVADEGT
jgi:hypothetical protein